MDPFVPGSSDDGRIVERVDLGIAEVVPDRDRRDGWTLRLDGVAQSYVDLTHPTYLQSEYLHRVAAVIGAVGEPPDPIRVLHLGGGALTLPRYVAATRPGSVQVVVERDAKLMSLVQRVLPLPTLLRSAVRIGDARSAVEAMDGEEFDLVIGDVAIGGEVPRSIATRECAQRIAHLLPPGGIYALNVPDSPALDFVRRVGATLRLAFADVCAVSEPFARPNRRFANAVFAAGSEPGSVPVRRIAEIVSSSPFPGRPLYGAQLDRFIGGAEPLSDA